MFDTIFHLLAKMNARAAVAIYMKLYTSFRLWRKNGPGYYSKFYGAIVDAWSRYESKKKFDFLTTGDSVMFAGRFHWIRFPSTTDRSIPGDTIDNFSKRTVANIARFGPRVVYVHIGGNDILEAIVKGKFSVEFAADLSNRIFATLKEIKAFPSVQKVVWEEILPLGRQHPEANSAAIVVNTIMKAKARAMPHVFEVLPIRDVLAGPDGFILDRYSGEDGIHINMLAYDEAWYPYWEHHVSKTATAIK